ncbi:hypothetical protein [Acetobacter okinawensis]|uniref:hypothetical protein n=1 Tax=Acetobacter okinawensis TaxID=1076594 RepID=UPI0020A18563|nr:hypothetical protein [Acetobacter okinawensis]MCP1214363.1 hypothetical protein [Acetobacter okinawensis]
MDARDRQARIEIILPDDEAAALYVTDASVLRLARLIGRQMAREDYERQKRRRRRTHHPAGPARKT